MSDTKWSEAVMNIEGVPLDLVGETFALPTSTTALLDDVAAAVNTSDKKIQGAVMWNVTTDIMCIAVGNAAADLWVEADGTTQHSPS